MIAQARRRHVRTGIGPFQFKGRVRVCDQVTCVLWLCMYRVVVSSQVGWQEDVSLPKEKSQLPADCERVVEEEASAYEAERINFEEERQLAEQRVNERRAVSKA